MDVAVKLTLTELGDAVLQWLAKHRPEQAAAVEHVAPTQVLLMPRTVFDDYEFRFSGRDQ